MNTSSRTAQLWSEASTAIRHNFLPGLVLWAVAAAVVLSYYLVPAVHPGFAVIATWKASGGFLYSILATALFAGVLPFVFLWLMPKTRPQATWNTFIFTVAFWAYRGLEIDAFYRLQGLLFGTEPTWTTVASKVAVDLFLYNVVWAGNLQLLTYHWKNMGFRSSAFRNFPWADYGKRQLPVALLSTWAVWLPVLIFVYSLPADLQIPLFNLAACFWALVMATLTSKGSSQN